MVDGISMVGLGFISHWKPPGWPAKHAFGSIYPLWVVFYWYWYIIGYNSPIMRCIFLIMGVFFFMESFSRYFPSRLCTITLPHALASHM
tara:strand:+ start:236 stop:502 length:267 start_codon:yes stop_codon:yes gene_type:complete